VNHALLPANANSGLYAGLVVVFMVWTYGLALWLDEILDFVEPRWKGLQGRLFVHPLKPRRPRLTGRVSLGRSRRTTTTTTTNPDVSGGGGGADLSKVVIDSGLEDGALGMTWRHSVNAHEHDYV
jgi:hypothetical protein